VKYVDVFNKQQHMYLILNILNSSMAYRSIGSVCHDVILLVQYGVIDCDAITSCFHSSLLVVRL